MFAVNMIKDDGSLADNGSTVCGAKFTVEAMMRAAEFSLVVGVRESILAVTSPIIKPITNSTTINSIKVKPAWTCFFILMIGFLF